MQSPKTHDHFIKLFTFSFLDILIQSTFPSFITIAKNPSKDMKHPNTLSISVSALS